MNGTTRGIVALLALLGIGLWMRKRQTNNLQETIEANWKEIKKKLPSDWSAVAARKRRQARQMINNIHKSTGKSRRRIRKTLVGLTS
jgi:hypothetical protein